MLQWINCIQTIPSIRTNKVTHWNFEFNMLTRFAVSNFIKHFKFYKTFDNNWIWTQCISMHFVTVRQYDISMCTSQVVVLLFNASHQQRDTCCSWRSLCFVNPFTDSALFFLKCITLSVIDLFQQRKTFVRANALQACVACVSFNAIDRFVHDARTHTHTHFATANPLREKENR